jgi:hypothetical protein
LKRAAHVTGRRYTGWSAAEIAADQALADSISALRQADGLLSPALDDIFARGPPKQETPPAYPARQVID